MKKILLAFAAIPAATMAVEASAQTNMNANGAVGVQNRILNLEARLNAGVQAGVIDAREHSILRSRLNELRAMERQYSMNGLTSSERRTLQNRIRSLRDEMRTAGGSWANQYGWSDRELDVYGNAYGSSGVRTDQYGRPVDQYGRVIANTNTNVRYDQHGRAVDQYGRVIADANVRYDQHGRAIDQYGRVIADANVRYDQHGRAIDQYGRVIADANVRVDQYGRPVDQYGRVIANGGVAVDQYGRPVSNGYYGQGGPYEPVPQSSGMGNVLGGVLGSVLGGGSGAGGVLGNVLGGGGLSVGSVITSAIANALGRGTNYGYQDRSNVYFRSDGRQVYEIDARTNRVIRIHPIQ
jgi:hypothetical protein